MKHSAPNQTRLPENGPTMRESGGNGVGDVEEEWVEEEEEEDGEWNECAKEKSYGEDSGCNVQGFENLKKEVLQLVANKLATEILGQT